MLAYSFNPELKTKITEFGEVIYRDFISKESKSMEEFLSEYNMEKENLYKQIFSFRGQEKYISYIDVGVSSMWFIHIETKPQLISIYIYDNEYGVPLEKNHFIEDGCIVLHRPVYNVDTSNLTKSLDDSILKIECPIMKTFPLSVESSIVLDEYSSVDDSFA